MSLVPLVLRDWYDDIDRFDRDGYSRLLDQHFGLGLKKDELLSNFSSALLPSLVRPSRRYFRPWSGELANRLNTGTSAVSNDSKEFQVILDVQQFAADEITVKVNDQAITVEGKHQEKPDEHGYVSRHFVRRYVLPKDVQTENVASNLSSDGVLTITAPKKVLINDSGERVVPIQQTGVPAITAAGASEPVKILNAPKETQIKVEKE